MTDSTTHTSDYIIQIIIGPTPTIILCAYEKEQRRRVLEEILD